MRLPALLTVALVLMTPLPAALAGPDRVTGGVTVPDGRLTGGGADGGEPVTPAPEAAAATGAAALPAARAAQEADTPADDTVPREPEDEEDVEVGVPVPQETTVRPAAAAPPGGSPGGLAQTGFAVAALAAAGALCAAAGLGLRRLTRP